MKQQTATAAIPKEVEKNLSEYDILSIPHSQNHSYKSVSFY